MMDPREIGRGKTRPHPEVLTELSGSSEKDPGGSSEKDPGGSCEKDPGRAGFYAGPGYLERSAGVKPGRTRKS